MSATGDSDARKRLSRPRNFCKTARDCHRTLSRLSSSNFSPRRKLGERCQSDTSLCCRAQLFRTIRPADRFCQGYSHLNVSPRFPSRLFSVVVIEKNVPRNQKNKPRTKKKNKTKSVQQRTCMNTQRLRKTLRKQNHKRRRKRANKYVEIFSRCFLWNRTFKV